MRDAPRRKPESVRQVPLHADLAEAVPAHATPPIAEAEPPGQATRMRPRWCVGGPAGGIAEMMRPIAAHHLADLAKSGLTLEDAQRYGIHSVIRQEAKLILGFDPGSDGLLFAAPSLNGGRPSYQFKPDRPFTDKEGRPVKYLSPKNSRNHLQVPADLLQEGVLQDAGLPLVVTEGRKKSLKATKAGFPCVSLSGVWCFRQAGPDDQGRPIPDLDLVAWEGRQVFVAYDSDAVTKPAVRGAEQALAQELGRRGAIVKLVRLPGGPDDRKVGLDDFLVMHGAEGAAELRKLLDSAEPATVPGYELTDAGNGKRLAARHGRDMRYDHRARQWYVWNQQRWLLDARGRVQAWAKETARAIYVEAANEPDPDRSKRLGNHATHTQSRRGIESMIAMCASEPGIALLAEELDADPWLFGVLNGTVDLRSGDLRPHRQEELISKIAPASYNPAAACPTWFRFLTDALGGSLGLIGFLRRAVGASLAGVQRDHVLLILYGPGANGKSTFVETLLAMFGDYGQQTSTKECTSYCTSW